MQPGEREDEDTTAVIFEADPSMDVRPLLFRTLAAKSIPLVGLENISLTLEDIFARLTLSGEVK